MKPMIRAAALVALACGGFPGADAAAPSAGSPVRLSALPPSLASGPSGPLNRFAVEVRHFDPVAAGATVDCLYPDGSAYLCRTEREPGMAPGETSRVQVTVPDLGRGTRVVIRFANARGSAEVPVDLANRPQLVHEIEAITLPDGGATTIRGDGTEMPSRQLATHRAATWPALAAPAPATPGECEQIVAEWIDASATDAVFASRFGPLQGSLTLSKVARGRLVGAQTLPEWTIAYPLGATRVQFIAHYEVIYRATACVARQRPPRP